MSELKEFMFHGWVYDDGQIVVKVETPPKQLGERLWEGGRVLDLQGRGRGLEAAITLLRKAVEEVQKA